MSTTAIQNNSTIPGATAPSGSDTSSKKASGLLDPLTDKNTFITLLVAQLKNQDPLQPTDGIQFLSQLTQISSVEQLVNIREDTDKLANGSSMPIGAPQDDSNSTTQP